MAEKKLIKTNKNHGGKEFTAPFHIIGKVKHVRTQEEGSESWVDVPFYREEKDDYGNPKKVLEFVVETNENNDLKVKMSGKEMQYAYPFSSTLGRSERIDWKDRFDKTKYPDETYHYIEAEWDKIDSLKELIQKDMWVEVKGEYSPYKFKGNNNNEIKGISRQAKYINKIIDGKVEIEGELKDILVNGDKIDYVTDFKSPNFVEVNNYKMQIGIKSTFQDEKTKNTKVNAVFLTYGKEKSQPKDVELTVYYNKPENEKEIALADAFNSLERLDFIEVIGTDHNRAEFTMVDVEEKLDEDDPFNFVAGENKTAKKERVVTGSRKGLEITGYVAGTKYTKLLKEDEITESDGNPIDISDDDLPF